MTWIWFLILIILVNTCTCILVEIPLAGLTPQHFFACPNLGPGFPMSYVVVPFNVQRYDVRDDCSFC